MNLVKGGIEFVMDILETIVFVGSLFIVVYLFVLQPNQVKGTSMEPNFHSGDYIFTSKVTYKMRTPQRGDVVVFKSPGNPDIEYIKRVIGLPGETVMVKGGSVYVNNIPLSEPYTSNKTTTFDSGYLKEGVSITIGLDELFVLGDNRPLSSDSREFGPIPINSIIGNVFYRYFPANELGAVKNPIPANLRHELSLGSQFLHHFSQYLGSLSNSTSYFKS